MVQNELKYIIIRVILSFLALISGALIYVLLRPSEDIYFVKLLGLNYLNLNLPYKPNWIYNISVALHTYSMSLLSSIFVDSTKKNYMLIIFFWMFINIIFEILQEPYVNNIVYDLLNTETFGYIIDSLLSGTYDINDILFTIYGSFVAYITLVLLKID